LRISRFWQDFLKHLEICVNLGFSFLFESVDEYIDPIVDPVLEKNLVKKGNSRTVKIGDKDVEWDDSFRLYLTSKIANPHYGPEIFGGALALLSSLHRTSSQTACILPQAR
jgi:dynein heavy chain